MSNDDLEKDIVDKIMCLDPITVEYIKQLFRQRKDAVNFENEVKICKYIFQTFIKNEIIDKSAKIIGSGTLFFREGQQAIWFVDIGKLLEKNS